MKTCFVVMPIGDQEYGSTKLTKVQLKKRYDGLIKESLNNLDVKLDVVRADELIVSGSISREIYLKLISSEYVVVDISYPNPNVFYELGIRHAIKNKTILIKEKNSPTVPFDISHLNYIEYEDSGSGLAELKEEFNKRFKAYEEENPIDNEFLHIVHSLKNLIKKRNQKIKIENKKRVFTEVLSNPELTAAILNGDDEKATELLSKNENMAGFVSALFDSEILE